MRNEVIPKANQLAIENVSGIVISVRNAGTATIGSAHSISLTADIISAPTRTSAGEVAAAGIIATKGATKKATRNVQRPSSPLRLPCALASSTVCTKAGRGIPLREDTFDALRTEDTSRRSAALGASPRAPGCSPCIPCTESRSS
jgi:hypothetical protein